MVHLPQHAAGPGCQRRRMVIGVVLWFLISGLIGAALPAIVDESREDSHTIQNSTKGTSQAATLYKREGESSVYKGLNTASLLHRSSRELPRMKDTDELPIDGILEPDRNSETIQRSPIKSKTLFVIPYLRPGRSDNRNGERSNTDTRNTVISLAGSDSDLINTGRKSESGTLVSKKHDTVIPMVRFGRNSDKRQMSSSNSVIPYPRLGRSLSPDDADNNIYGSSEDEYVGISGKENGEADGNEMHEDSELSEKRQKKESYDYDTIIPYPRPGRYADQEAISSGMFEKEQKRADSDYVLPQIRYGRSMFLLSPPKTDESAAQNSHTFVLPYPRPGRSSKQPEKNEYSKKLQIMIPYPRPGRSTFGSDSENLNWDKRQKGYKFPFARLGRSGISIPSETKASMINDDIFNDFIINSLFLKSEQKNSPNKPKDNPDLSSVFMIPYPRPGKKSVLKTTGSQGKQKQNNPGKEFSDYVLPYPRPGKKSLLQLFPKNFKNNNNNNNENESSQKFVLPYPRPGRSEADWFDENVGVEHQVNEDVDDSMFMEQNSNTDRILKNNAIDSKTMGMKEYFWNNSKKSKNTFVVPYAEIDRNFESVLPYLTSGHLYHQYKDGDMDSDLSLADYEPFVTEAGVTDLYNENDSHLRYKRSNSVVPYPRPGRSDMVIPYPRPGRSDSVVPYPRPGRSNFVVPYPRFGRSNSVIPYPRPGRSNSVIPYPRLGRSNSVVPYPRLGRSNSVVPYPRLGRSNSVVPYPRPGRSEFVVPYPRPGRSNSVLPYPRPGRSNSVVPYPRPGRSESVLTFPRLKRSLSVVPYPRPGRSRKEESLSASGYDDKSGDWVLPNLRFGRSDSYKRGTDIIPYPRPGRSLNVNDLLQVEDFDSYASKRVVRNVIPYPRPGRSQIYDQGYILPHPRFGRSSSNIKQQEGATNGNTIIPYPRFGRSEDQATPSPDLINSSHKLNKHMLTRVDDSIYLLPYPRPGRYSE